MIILKSTTTWYQGTIIAYKPYQGPIVSFNGCGPEENELIKSLKKAVEKKQITLLGQFINIIVETVCVVN